MCAKQISLAGFAVVAAESAEMFALSHGHLHAFPGERPSTVAISISSCFAFLRNIIEVFLSSPFGKAIPGYEILAAR